MLRHTLHSKQGLRDGTSSMEALTERVREILRLHPASFHPTNLDLHTEQLTEISRLGRRLEEAHLHLRRAARQSAGFFSSTAHLLSRCHPLPRIHHPPPMEVHVEGESHPEQELPPTNILLSDELAPYVEKTLHEDLAASVPLAVSRSIDDNLVRPLSIWIAVWQSAEERVSMIQNKRAAHDALRRRLHDASLAAQPEDAIEARTKLVDLQDELGPQLSNYRAECASVKAQLDWLAQEGTRLVAHIAHSLKYAGTAAHGVAPPQGWLRRFPVQVLEPARFLPSAASYPAGAPDELVPAHEIEERVAQPYEGEGAHRVERMAGVTAATGADRYAKGPIAQAAVGAPLGDVTGEAYLPTASATFPPTLPAPPTTEVPAMTHPTPSVPPTAPDHAYTITAPATGVWVSGQAIEGGQTQKLRNLLRRYAARDTATARWQRAIRRIILYNRRKSLAAVAADQMHDWAVRPKLRQQEMRAVERDQEREAASHPPIPGGGPLTFIKETLLAPFISGRDQPAGSAASSARHGHGGQMPGSAALAHHARQQMEDEKLRKDAEGHTASGLGTFIAETLAGPRQPVEPVERAHDLHSREAAAPVPTHLPPGVTTTLAHHAHEQMHELYTGESLRREVPRPSGGGPGTFIADTLAGPQPPGSAHEAMQDMHSAEPAFVPQTSDAAAEPVIAPEPEGVMHPVAAPGTEPPTAGVFSSIKHTVDETPAVPEPAGAEI